ncbi:MAG TPA: cell division protein FtsQ [Chryseosolibacter sp.]|nr:cell division protein FtsQ [Chryseosolibacter sp.]
MKVKINIRRELRIAAVLITVFGLIAFTERMKDTVAVRGVHVEISNINENHFLDHEDILHLMQWNQENMKGLGIEKLNFRQLESRIKKDPFISDAQIYSDLKGNVLVNVELRRPVARIVRADGPDGYIAEDGTIMPVSDKFTARVVLVTGAFIRQLLSVRNVNEMEEGLRLFEMIQTIRHDEFWNAQVTQLDVDAKGEVTLLTQVGDEMIEFGLAENVEQKLIKLKIFYKEIIPRVGWNKYDRVNLEYDGQIVAE